MNHPDSNDLDALGQLLRTAGVPKEPDEVQTARVRADVQQHWQAGVARRQRRNRLRYGAGFGTLVAAAAVWMFAVIVPHQAVMPAETGGAVVERLEGAVFLQLAGQATPNNHLLAVGDELPRGATIISGAGERLAVRLPNGMSLRVDQASRLVYQDALNLTLEQGAIYVSSAANAPEQHQSIRVHTNLGAVRDIGTQFEVRLDGEGLRVRVREGEIELDHADSKTSAKAGTDLRLTASGVLQHNTIDAHDDSWAWVSGIAPIPAFEGKNLGFFLDWYARERGLAMVFEQPANAAQHRMTEINGKFAGFSPDTLLEVVLPACGLDYENQGGAILIKEAPGEQL